MRTLVTADIHGYARPFRELLERVEFSMDDRLIILGDLIDRGPDSRGVLEYVYDLDQKGYHITCLMGNHEQMLLDSLNSRQDYMLWMANGGMATLASFNTQDIRDIPHELIAYIRSFRYYHEEGGFIYVHAGIDMRQEKPLEDRKSLLWLRDWQSCFDENWLGNRKVVHGHTPMPRPKIRQQIDTGQPVIDIDNGSYFNMPGYGGICLFEPEGRKVEIVSTS